MVQSQPEQIVPETLSQKYPTQNRAGTVTQMAQPLHSKYKALGSDLSTTKKKKKERKKEGKEEEKEKKKEK
jgi:hypothetical protein